jgi:hypothetical protein
MTRKQLNAVVLTEQQLDQVSGGASSNQFNTESGVPSSKPNTGSANSNGPDPNAGAINGGHGTLNIKFHTPV